MQLRFRLISSLLLFWCGVGVVLSADFTAVEEALEQGQPDLAEQQLEALGGGDNSAAREKYRARIALQRQDYKLAITHAIEATELEASADHFSLLGDCYGLKARDGGGLGRLGAAKKARKSWERAIEIDPRHIDAHSSLIQYHLNAPRIAGGNKDQAKALASALSEIAPEPGLQARYQVAAATGALGEAIELANQLVVSYPEQANYGVQLATTYHQSEEFEAARQALADNLDRHPQHWSTVYQVGRTAALSGEALDEGRQALEQFIAESGQNDGWLAAAHWRLAQVHQHSGDQTQAQASVNQALALQPDHKQAKQLAKQLRKR